MTATNSGQDTRRAVKGQDVHHVDIIASNAKSRFTGSGSKTSMLHAKLHTGKKRGEKKKRLSVLLSLACYAARVRYFFVFH